MSLHDRGFSRSVSLAVTERDPASFAKRSVKDFWDETFGRFTDEEKATNDDKQERERFRDQARRESEEKAFIPPKKLMESETKPSGARTQ